MTEDYSGYDLVPFRHKLNVKRIRWAVWSYFDIESKQHPGYVYLRRLRILQTPWFGWYVHWIFMPDFDQDPHDHPWNFWTWILRGGYTEDFYPFMRPRRAGSMLNFHKERRWWGRFTFHKMLTGVAHQITDITPGTISMVFVGHRQHEWGFYTSEGYVDWRVYNSEHYQQFREETS